MTQNKRTCKKTCGFYTAVFESCVDGLLISDMEGRITETNSAGCQMFGYPLEEITRKRDVELIGCDHVRDYENFKEQILPSCKLRLSSQGLRKNGSTFNTEIFSKVGAPCSLKKTKYNYVSFDAFIQ